MSGGILRFPWTTQPQSPVGIDQKWLDRGLAFAAIPGQAEYFSQKLPVQSGSSYLKVNPAGRAFSSPDTQIPGAFTYTVNIASAFDCTTIAVFRSVTAQDAYHYVPTLYFNSAEPVLFSSTGSQSVFSTTGNASTTITTLSAGRVYVLAGVKRGNSQEQYVNGALATTNVTGNRAIGAITTVSVGRPSGGNNVDKVEYAGIFYFTKALSASEIAELTRHYSKVWQVYRPIQRPLWLSSASGPTYTLTADSGSFTLTGQDAGLAFNRVLTADTQSFALTGQAAGLAFNRTLAAASGSFALTGQDAGLAFNRVLSAASGSYALDGQDVTLTYTPISGATYTLTAASGSFALAGQDTGLAFNRVLTADTQSYSLSGDVAGLAFNRVLTADTVSYALTGQDAALTYTGNTYTLNAESGTFFVDGQDANLVYSGGSSADTGDGSMSRKRYYLRRKGKILLFDTAAQADDYLEAEEEAQKAIAAAKSRGAKKRIAAKILKAVEPVESVEIAPLQELVKAYSMPVNLPQLLTQQDYQQVMDVRAMIQRIQDDEDDELLLLLA